MKKENRRTPASDANNKLTAEDWLSIARRELIRGGIMAVKVDCLARLLKVSRGSFYWHFESHDDLLERLLQSWVATNTAPFLRVLESDRIGREKFQAIIDLWLAEEEYDPKFDTAVREWARVSPHVARVVRRADNGRIDVLTQIFTELGYRGADALVRARIAYFHQVGYYTLGIMESSTQRHKLGPYYTRALLGED
jgi:AcrR family transcriptional regulator